MAVLFTSKKKESSVNLLRTYFDENQLWKSLEDPLEIAIKIIAAIRPKNPTNVERVELTDWIDFLQSNEFVRIQFSQYVTAVLFEKKISKILTDAGILQDVDFLFEVKKRIFAKILPYQPELDTLEYVLNQIFYVNTDPIWLQKIPIEQLEILAGLIGFTTIYDSVEPKSVLFEIMMSMTLISQRMSGRALESDVFKMVPEYINQESPFAAFEKELLSIEERIKTQKDHFITSDDLSYKQLMVLHTQCEEFVGKAFQNSSKFGITLRVNQNLLRIRQQLHRLKVLMPLLTVDNPSMAKMNGLHLAFKLIKYNCTRNNVRTFIKESTQLLSYEITQHTAKTGEKYITESKTEYFKMFLTALGGGLIVGILCIIKVLLSKLETSDFGHAFLYSMNYSFGFIAIYILGFTLATKQPAMTAAALIRALEDGIKDPTISDSKYQGFARFFARVFRSQFIAFVGNVLMAFPVSLLGIWLIDLGFDYNIAQTKWKVLVTDLSPIHSLAIFHAAIAGVFLFLSGIISGSVANRDKHYQMFHRIKENPFLKRTLGKVKAEKIAKWYEHKWAGIISNFWFGVFMGSTASVGLFLGLNLDIRHITFASGNLALGLYGSNYALDNWMLFWGICGIGVIGLINFSVSFTLSLGLAFRSRDIPFTELSTINRSIWQHFKNKPFSFFFPVGLNAVNDERGDSIP
mgnify:FL=1